MNCEQCAGEGKIVNPDLTLHRHPDGVRVVNQQDLQPILIRCPGCGGTGRQATVNQKRTVSPV